MLHSGLTRRNQAAGHEPFERAPPPLQVNFQLFRDPATPKMSKRGCPRACPRGYRLFIKKFRLPNGLPRSGATRLNQPAGPTPFERTRPLLQIKISLFRDLDDPAIRESSFCTTRRRTDVGGNITRVECICYRPKLVVRKRRTRSFDSTPHLGKIPSD